jgi:hypothetical protein
MKKFLVVYHAPMDAAAMERMANFTPEQMAKGFEAWTNWAQRCGDRLVDMGSPLTGGQQLGVGGSVKGSERNVTGYSIVQAENMDEAKALLQGHPHLGEWNPTATIEIHETFKLPGM